MSCEHKCPLCDSESSQFIESNFVFGGKDTQKYIQCKECDLYYLHPKPTEKELNDFYKENFESFMQNRSGNDSNWENAEKHCEISQRDAQRRILFIDEALKESKTILEVGASTGFMIDFINDRYHGKDIYAVEPSSRFCHYMRNKNIKAVESMEQLPNDIGFDLIIHFFVVAHVYNFEEFLTTQYKKLNTGGKLIFETPSVTDALRTLYDIPSFHDFYWQVAHLVSFSNKSMKYLLDKLGFEYKIIPHQRYDISNHMVWMQTGKPGGRGKYAQVFSQELENEYKKNLESNWLCDAMIVEIKKP